LLFQYITTVYHPHILHQPGDFFFPRPQWQINWAAPPARWPRPNWCPQIFMGCCDETIPTDINDIPLDIPHLNQEWDMIFIDIPYIYTHHIMFILKFIYVKWFHGHFMVICGYGISHGFHHDPDPRYAAFPPWCGWTTTSLVWCMVRSAGELLKKLGESINIHNYGRVYDKP
jgi:hypothetical protein